MDYEHKKSYRSLITLVFVLIGFFVAVWNHEVLISTVSQQAALIQDSFDSEGTEQDNFFPILISSLQEQKQELGLLKESNTLLQEELLVYTATTSTSTEVEFQEVPPKRVLLVAGHTAVTKGAVFGDTTEYELNYDIMKKLEREMKSRGFEVFVSHEGSDYTKSFLNYFDTNEERILDYREKKKDAYDKQYPQGVVTNDTDHNHASPLGVVQLYGVNLWANENNIDAVVHLHFNDYPGRPTGTRGTHTGFSIFAPLKTNDHFVESFSLAKSVEKHMLKYIKRSTVRNESAGVLESELIAVGQANSTLMPSILIENGFIYESKFTDTSRREPVLARQANSIANGIEEYFQNR